ncbi:TROVE domain-containing protein [Kineococcus xinjiangensis]|uniref:TROVE domain-containing protein n=1 Tax=Kineococcus xinjiangensis TaxID=512762 RepID=A0A2S6IUI3_9ACTN|nr:TROVE domain-containing protein [Kineococcus xinjiangensis]PPK97795.1 TROVE domain-containing protein [Kineococcus xinjiangensis]
MARFSGIRQRLLGRAPQRTLERTTTHEGGAAFVRDARSDLFLLAAVNMVGQDSFYEGAGERDERFRRLVHAVTVQDPDWVARFVPFLRNEMNMRTAAVVMAAESARARRDLAVLHSRPDPATTSIRRMVDSALQRADEPAEFLGYWWSRYGKAMPKGVQRGLADAVTRLYDERAVLRYDGNSRAIRMADVVELVHPTPRAPWQSQLFRALLDERHHGDRSAPQEEVRALSARDRLVRLAPAERHALARLVRAGDAAATAEFEAATAGQWEWVRSWLGEAPPADGLTPAEQWELVIPLMGVMALVRNLRGFDEAGVSDEVAATVAAKLADPDVVARSRMFPYRFLSAALEAPSPRWAWPLEQAVRASTAAVPALGGRTLVLCDTSASMSTPVSQRSKVQHVDVGALFAAVLACRGERVDLVAFASGWEGVPVRPAEGVLRTVQRVRGRIGAVGHGTETAAALRASYAGHDRVVIVSDMQAFADARWGRGASVSTAAPAHVPVYGVNTTGYAPAALDLSERNRYEIGGFSDKLFSMIAMVEGGRDAGWPF